MARLPDLTGMKNEVIAPNYSRNVYDHAIRMLGVKIVDVANEDELRQAIGPKTAMIMVLATPEDTGPFGLKPIADIAKAHRVPVLVDAAAEGLTIPNVHLQRGADLVAYSGGKALRGPQAAGLLLGRKDLVQAAWLNSAPHHAFGRPMKVGKEEIMGMLAAVEMWVRRDHDAEFRAWEAWLAEISRSVERVPSVSTEVRQPRGLSNRSPSLTIRWDGAKVGITGEQLYQALYNGDPRIVLGGSSRGDNGQESVSITPWQMKPESVPIVAREMHRVLSQPPKQQEKPKPSGPTAAVAGQWNLHVHYVMGSANHALVFEQDGASIVGTHVGERTSSDLRGQIEADQIHFRSFHRWEASGFPYEFQGRVQGDSMSGEVQLGEYGSARWSAKRHEYGQPGGLVRPVKNI
jgi:L-seryl-tRNA(Ser) seleniumtransferase